MKQKIFRIITILQIVIFLFSFGLIAQTNKSPKLKTIVIDPGHGGSDPGAVGKFSKEKDLTLKISKKFGDLINVNFKDVKVIYTRTDDRNVELYKRAEIANKNNADLFISIHINSFKKTDPYGTETYVMGLSKNAQNIEVAKKENSVILNEKEYQNNYGGYDPKDPESDIIIALIQNAYRDQSLLFSQYIQDNYTKNMKRLDRGVKEAAFLVLWQCTMPSVLTELGFISNYDEELYLNSEKAQNDFSKALYNAFVIYKCHYEGITLNDKMLYKIDDKKDTETDSVEIPKEQEIILPTDYNQVKYPDQIVYKIQIVSSADQIQIKPENFKTYKNVEEYFHNGIYKYTVYEELEQDKINELLAKVRVDYKDCFVVKFKNGERILK